MSDNWISVIPRDPHYMPTPHQADSALAFLRDLAPESESVEFKMDDEVKFRDCGANFESVACPLCQASIDQEWWSDKMSENQDGESFHLRPIRLPCCDGAASLNDLIYSFNQGFSRFILEAMNPNIGELQPEQTRRLSDLLGTELRVIYQHI